MSWPDAEALLRGRLTLRVDEVGRLLSCSRRTVYRMIDKGDLRAVRLGTEGRGGVRVLAESVRRALREDE